MRAEFLDVEIVRKLVVFCGIGCYYVLHLFSGYDGVSFLLNSQTAVYLHSAKGSCS